MHNLNLPEFLLSPPFWTKKISRGLGIQTVDGWWLSGTYESKLFFSHEKQLSSVLGLVTCHWWLCSCTNDADHSCFLEFCYITQWEVVNTQSLNALEEALSHFHHYCVIFEECGVHPNDFNLPQQHFLVHYPAHIQVFSSPNGLCSSITESKHIKAVKQPWQHFSHYKALGQMLLTNQCLN